MKFHFSSINLGCNKNLVDLEFIIWEILSKSSDATLDIAYFESPDDEEVDYVIINTCWFLSTSREEAESNIRYYDDLWKKIIIVWCYIQVSNEEFLKSLKNLYKIIPFISYDSVLEILNLDSWKKVINSDYIKWKKLDKFISDIKSNQVWDKAFIWKWDEVRAYINSPYKYEYLKIAEWCDNACTFCIIPKIRWKQKSRKIEDIVEEAKLMINNWIKEIILIAQDTTRYWKDIYSEPKLIELLSELEKIDADFKYRILYMYPDNLSLNHLEKLKSFKKFIPYFDIPFQHISVSILKKMWRYYDTDAINNFLLYIKENFDEYHIRTSFIIWFPWESEEDFKELSDFIQKNKFDSVALFEYHDEQLAASSKFIDKIDSSISVKRIKKLDKILSEIYLKKNIDDKWKYFCWFLEWFEWNSILVRRQLRAPEIDELDKIKKSQILTKWDLDIWDFIEYKII